jgi:hypothetical protein
MNATAVVLRAISAAGIVLIYSLNAIAASPSGPRTASSTPERPQRLLAEGSAGSVRIGMTVAQARRAVRPLTLRRTSDGEGVALIDVLRGQGAVMTLSANTAADSLCSAGERIVFSAFVQGSNKLASICTSSRLDERQGYLQYRFGRPGRVELQFPSSKQHTQKAFTYTRYTRPLVTYLTLTFRTRDYRYSIHQDSDAEMTPASDAAYITVDSLLKHRGGSTERTISLRGRVKGSLLRLEGVVPNESWTKE